MKWFFYGLLLANVAFFGWIRLHPHAGTAPAAPTERPAGGSRLTLLRELPKLPPLRSATTALAATAPASIAPAAPPKHAPPPVASTGVPSATKVAVRTTSPCRRISGFESEAGARRAARALRRAGVKLRGRGSVSTEENRYWIILPPFKSMTAARAAVARLHKAGVKDYYLLRGGDNKNAISLGVYSGHEAARRRYWEIRNLKFHPRIQKITISATRWWVDFEPAGGGSGHWRDALGAGERNLPVSACPTK